MRRYYALPRYLHHFFTLRKNARLETSKLTEMQEKKLRAMVRHAYENVPFYHRRFEANNVKPSQIRTTHDLRKIPIVTRKEAQENSSSMISVKTDSVRCAQHKTSGSTGIPLAVFSDNYAQEHMSVVALRQFLECGGRLRDKQIQLRGQGGSNLPNSRNKPFYERIGFLRTEWVIPIAITESIISYLRMYKPNIIVGYPSFMQIIYEKIESQNGAEISPRIIFCTGEVLNRHCRAMMESAFGTQVVDSYGCTEAGDLAWECPDEDIGYHINADSVILEFVKDGESAAPGEEGEIVLTNLFNYAMPFIRYNIGDVGVPSDERCPCKRTLPLMHLLKGRSDDFIILPDGKRLSPLGILNMENFAQVSEYRVIQEKRDLVVLLLKMKEAYRKESVIRCVSALQKSFGTDIKIETEIVEEIPRDNSGKLRRIISKVAL